LIEYPGIKLPVSRPIQVSNINRPKWLERLKIKRMKAMVLEPKLSKKPMGKLMLPFALFLVLALGAALQGSAQIYVNVRPVAPVVVRTAAPTPHHVWIGEEWEVRNGVYVHTGGRWAEPPHPGWMWVPGHWVREHRGEIWRPGHWRRA
jgi:hypothetical protein